jgi:Zn-dependent protease
MFKLGKMFGVTINLHWTLALLAVFICPQIYPTLVAYSGYVVGALLTLIVCVAFVGSILWHELAHSLVGKRLGIAMDEITLFIFGGAAHMKSELRRPNQEFWISLAGPVASIVLGIGFVVLTLIL